jgi:hypothetical protein
VFLEVEKWYTESEEKVILEIEEVWV